MSLFFAETGGVLLILSGLLRAAGLSGSSCDGPSLARTGAGLPWGFGCFTLPVAFAPLRSLELFPLRNGFAPDSVVGVGVAAFACCLACCAACCIAGGRLH